MMKSEVVVNASLFMLVMILVIGGRGVVLPANAVLGHFPGGTFRSVPEVARLDDILLQRTGHLPLVVVVCCGWRGDVSTR